MKECKLCVPPTHTKKGVGRRSTMTASRKEGQNVTSKKEIFIVVLKGQRRSPPAPVQYSIVEAIRSAEYPAKSVPVPMPCIPSASLALLLTKFRSL